MTVAELGLLEDASALRDYMVKRSLIGSDEPIQVAPLGGGISNQIAKITTPSRSYVIKQAQPKLRVAVDWFASVDRVLIEADCMKCLSGLLPAGTVPQVYFIDSDKYLYGMECAPEASVLWKAELLSGDVDIRVASFVGKILGLMHGQTAKDDKLAAKFWDNHILHDLRLDPCLTYLAGIHTDLQSQIADQFERLDHTKLCLVHGDYTPKNMLHSDDRLVLLDYEIAHWGNPALDSGFLIAHLLLKIVRAPQWAERYIAAARAFWLSYIKECQTLPQKELESEAAHLVPYLVLARIDSKSPVEYIVAEERKQAARDLAIPYIVRPTTHLEEIYSTVLKMAAEMLHTQHPTGVLQ